MKRHPFNVFSLGFGVVLILLAVGLVVPAELSDEFSRFATVRWLLPLAMVLVGVSMLSSLFRRRESGAEPDPVEAATETHGESEIEAEAETESASG
ncbi:MAG: hypothetical protein OXK16_10640 [bacterium]|nr:hypothetical protein [bacterium]MDE0376406.1 hypothetical protein [bacterium]